MIEREWAALQTGDVIVRRNTTECTVLKRAKNDWEIQVKQQGGEPFWINKLRMGQFQVKYKQQPIPGVL